MLIINRLGLLRLVLKDDENNLDALLMRGNAYYKIGEPNDIETALRSEASLPSYDTRLKCTATSGGD